MQDLTETSTEYEIKRYGMLKLKEGKFLGYGTLDANKVHQRFIVFFIDSRIYFWNKNTETAHEIIQTEDNKLDIQKLKNKINRFNDCQEADQEAFMLITSLIDCVSVAEAFIKLAQAYRIYYALTHSQNKTRYQLLHSETIKDLEREISALSKGILSGFIKVIIYESKKIMDEHKKSYSILDNAPNDIIKGMLEQDAKILLEKILNPKSSKHFPLALNFFLRKAFVDIYNVCNPSNLIKTNKTNRWLENFKKNIFQSTLTKYSTKLEINNCLMNIEKTISKIKSGQIEKLWGLISAFNESTLKINTSITSRQFTEEEISEFIILLRKLTNNKFSTEDITILNAIGSLKNLKPFYHVDEKDIFYFFKGKYLSYFNKLLENQDFKMTLSTLQRATLAIKPLDKIKNSKKSKRLSRDLLKIFFNVNIYNGSNDEQIKFNFFLNKLLKLYQVLPRILLPLNELSSRINYHTEKYANFKSNKNLDNENPNESLFMHIDVSVETEEDIEENLKEIESFRDILYGIKNIADNLNLLMSCIDYIEEIDTLIKFEYIQCPEYHCLSSLRHYFNNISTLSNNNANNITSILKEIENIAKKNKFELNEMPDENPYARLMNNIYQNYVQLQKSHHSIKTINNDRVPEKKEIEPVELIIQNEIIENNLINPIILKNDPKGSIQQHKEQNKSSDSLGISVKLNNIKPKKLNANQTVESKKNEWISEKNNNKPEYQKIGNAEQLIQIINRNQEDLILKFLQQKTDISIILNTCVNRKTPLMYIIDSKITSKSELIDLMISKGAKYKSNTPLNKENYKHVQFKKQLEDLKLYILKLSEEYQDLKNILSPFYQYLKVNFNLLRDNKETDILKKNLEQKLGNILINKIKLEKMPSITIYSTTKFTYSYSNLSIFLNIICAIFSLSATFWYGLYTQQDRGGHIGIFTIKKPEQLHLNFNINKIENVTDTLCRLDD